MTWKYLSVIDGTAMIDEWHYIALYLSFVWSNISMPTIQIGRANDTTPLTEDTEDKESIHYVKQGRF